MSAQVYLDGQQNLAATSIPGVYIGIVPPQPFMTGASSNVMGIPGVGQWGPVGGVVYFNTPDECASLFGTPQIRKYDIPSFVAAASQVGTSASFAATRVAVGDLAASAIIQTNCITITGKYTGTLGNKIKVSIAAGTKAATFAVTVSFPGRQPEIFNNIAGTGNAFWVAVAAAINTGIPNSRGPSNYVIATVGAGTAAPTLATPVTLAGGNDGATGVTDAMVLGTDISPRRGMYALRNSEIDSFALFDVTATTTWAAQAAFAFSENCLAVLTTPSGDTPAGAAAARILGAIDDPYVWIIAGNQTYTFDAFNRMERLGSPQGQALGLLGNLSPEQSPLNKKLGGVIGTQASKAGVVYSNAELNIANTSGIDIITGPPITPGGNYFAFQTGRNSSSNEAQSGVEYTRLTNFIVRSINKGPIGQLIGTLQGSGPRDQTRANAKAIMDGFFSMLKDPSLGSGNRGMIDEFAVQCDEANNPDNLRARGFLFIYCKVKYLNVVRYIVIKFEGGGNVQVSAQNTPPSPTQFQ